MKNLVSSIHNAKSPYPPWQSTSDYDLSPDGNWVAFKSKAPQLPKANFTASYIYLTPHDGSKKPVAINGPESPGTPDGIKGDSHSPVFSPDNSKIAYLQMKEIDYESDRSIIYVHTIGSSETNPSVAKNWDRSPGSLKWAADGQSFLVSASDFARTRLFSVPVDAGADYKPKNFTDGGAVRSYHQLPDSSILVTGEAIWTNWIVYTTSPEEGIIGTITSANELDPALKNVGPADTDDFWFNGSWTDVCHHPHPYFP